MFNEEQKIAFIKETAKSASYQRTFLTPFNAAESFECKWGDISTWDKAQLTSFFIKRKYTSMLTMRSEVGAIRRYCAWCVEQKLVNDCEAIKSIDTSGFVNAGGIENKMIESPAALACYLESIFNDDTTENCAFKFYYWASFMGLFENEIQHIGRDDVDLDSLIIKWGNSEFPIYEEAIGVMTELCDKNDGKKPLLKTFADGLSSRTINTYVSRRKKEGVTILPLRNIRQSGIFYKVCQQEMIGVPVSFDEEVERIMSQREYSGYGDTAMKQKAESNRRGYLRRNLMQEYAVWKTLFDISIDNHRDSNLKLKGAREHVSAAKQIFSDVIKASKDTSVKAHLNTSIDLVEAVERHLDRIIQKLENE